jgi:ribose transport system permease protein
MSVEQTSADHPAQLAVSLEDTINRQTYGPLGYLASRQTFWVFIAAVIAFVYVSYASPSFFTPGNLFNILRNFAFVGIMGLGMTAVIITGGIDLSVGSVLCLAGMVTGMAMNADFSIWAALPMGLGAALVAGGVSGVLIAYVGMPPFVVTLGMMSLARSLAMVMSNNTMVFDFGRDHEKFIALGGGSTRDWFEAMARWVGEDSGDGAVFAWLAAHIDIPNPAVFLAVLALMFGFAFRWSRWGRHILAIGGNEQAAVLTGVPVRVIKVSVYMLSALMAGIAGILQVGWLGTITTGMGTGMELIVIAAVVIGGANLMGGSGTAFGAVVGAALIEIIRNSLTLLGINPFWQGTFVGVFIIVAVLFDRIRHNREAVMMAIRWLLALLRFAP